MPERSANQRDFYRVDCHVMISHCAVGDHVPAGRSPDSYFPDSEHFGLLRELRRMDHDASHLLHALGVDDDVRFRNVSNVRIRRGEVVLRNFT